MIVGFVLVTEEGAIGGILMGSGVVAIITGIISWAFLKVLVNISRNLFNLYDLIDRNFSDKQV